MNSERRHSLRKVHDPLGRIQLALDISGTLLNLSTGGLGFHAVSPVRRDGPVSCWFSFENEDRIEAVAELAWLDETNKVGGLHFIAITGQAREKIQNWIAPAGPPEAAVDRPALPATPSSASLTPRAPEPLAPPAAHVLDVAVSSNSRSHARSIFDTPLSTLNPYVQPCAPLGFPAYATGFRELVPVRRHLAVARWRFISGIIIGVASTALLAVPMSRFRAQRLAAPARADSGVLAAQSIAPKTSPETAPQDHRSSSSDISVHRSKAASAPAYSLGDPFAYTPSRLQPPRTLRPTGRLNPKDSPSILGAQWSPLPASENVAPPTAAVGNLASVEQLWAAFEAGSTTAAIKLADRYVQGAGVAKNCAQARVLLTVASKKGSASAQEKLHQLESGACAQP